ncbi:(2Fe-2S)-binding protein [Pseudonocardia sp. H11422]|uniref:(2Fe-2S)-binding protein n=1 Tax=Pseudonocardia sp. H11422 TaxID=2835866 RepID=UPI001BDBFB06|nr:(2Fe-2S)-binding protein [Pseudonocardia sp. H11422]
MNDRVNTVEASAEARLVQLRVNGEDVQGAAEPRMLLADFIRHVIGLKGTHVGCEQGSCGACTIRLNGKIVRSCIMFAVQANGAEIETVENLANGAELHPIQESYREKHGLQCGFCTPGLLMATQSLLEENPKPSEQDVREYLSGNICRCTGYVGVVAAVMDAADKLSSNSR